MSGTGGVYRLQLMGPFGLFDLGGRRIEIRSRKAMCMVALLAMAPQGVRTRSWLQLQLWGTRETAQAQSSLRRELATLAGLLEQHGAGHLLIRESQRVQLNLDLIDVDVLQIGVHPTAGIGAGDFLEGIDLRDCEEFEDWLRVQRNRVDELRQLEFQGSAAQPESASAVFGGALPPIGHVVTSNVLPLPPKPSVAVLPFAVSGTSGMDAWVGVALANDIGNALAQFPSLFVAASSAAATLAERGLTATEISKTLGVRYVLTGLVRAGDNQLRVAVQLVDGINGAQIWSKTIEVAASDRASIEPVIAEAVAPQIWTNIDLSERHRGLLEPISEPNAYQLYWRANALFRTWNRENIIEAIALTDELVRLNPACALSTSLAAFCNGIAYAFDWTRDRSSTRRAAIMHYQNALRIGGNNVEAIGYAVGTLISIGGDMGLADQLVSHALELLPSYQGTLFWGGWVDIARGNAARARERFELSLRISPVSGVRSYALTGIGIAALMEGDPQTAFVVLYPAGVELTHYPVTQAALAIASALNDRLDVAADALAALEISGGDESVLLTFQQEGARQMVGAGLAMARNAVASASQKGRQPSAA